MFNVNALLGPRVIPVDKETGKLMPKPADHDKFLECLCCGTIYLKYQVKQEANLTTLIDPDIDPFSGTEN